MYGGSCHDGCERYSVIVYCGMLGAGGLHLKHVTLKTVQAGDLLGTCMVAPVMTAVKGIVCYTYNNILWHARCRGSPFKNSLV